MLKRYDETLNSFRKMMDNGIKVIRTANEMNVNAVVEGLLGSIRRGNETDLTTHMQKLYQKRMEISMSMDSLKVFQRYMDIKNNLNFDNFVPTLDINEKNLREKVLAIYQTSMTADIKIRPPIETFPGVPGHKEEGDKKLKKTGSINFDDNKSEKSEGKASINKVAPSEDSDGKRTSSSKRKSVLATDIKAGLGKTKQPKTSKNSVNSS